MTRHHPFTLALSLLAITPACTAEPALDPLAPADPEIRGALAASSDPVPIPADDLVTYTEERQPCADRNPLRNAYFGDLHVHTGYSFDAYVYETYTDPFDAYVMAQQDPINLDFAAVTDHGEFFGETQLCTTPGSPSYESPACVAYRSILGGPTAYAAFEELTQEDPERWPLCGPDDTYCMDAAQDAWTLTQEAAELAYDRSDACEFTAFVAYEYTGRTGGSNLHRNVVFRNAEVPSMPTTYFEAPTPHQLWDALEADCLDEAGGCDVLAIPHNSNYGNGDMFALSYPGAGSIEEEAEQAARRAALEPLMEIIQHKAASECRPGFSADEYCDFEVAMREPCNGDGSGSGSECSARNDFLRGALADGLAEQQRLGVNPLQLGVIASTDTHNGVPGAVAEDDFDGHVGVSDELVVPRLLAVPEFGPGGLAGVWAVENSRDAIFEALERRETFGTSGPRIVVRMFGGWSFEPDLCNDPDLLEQGYAAGVPMGGDLGATPSEGAKPRFVVVADQDQLGLQRAHIIKVWVDAQGQAHEEVHEVAGGDNGASVDPNTCEPTGSGAATLCGSWVDDGFDPDVPAVYYARVLENPSCRWSTYDCNSLPDDLRPPACNERPTAIQERAWTSPIWYADAL